jgi:hypothetical protein
MCLIRRSARPLTGRSHAAVVIADHHEQGWTLLCNGVVHFDDGVDLLPGGAIAGSSSTISNARVR